jgi:hypothetical protein
MNSRQRLLTSLEHREPDRIPVDFGSTAVTGMHVSCVAALRERFGLDRHAVKVTEPYQMLGEVEEDLATALGLDAVGVQPRKTLFGFANENWKPWRMYDGLEVRVPGDFNVTVEPGGDTLIYPEGDLSAPPSGRMPKDGYFFDTIVRQEPLGDEWRVEDNLEEFQPVSGTDLDYFAAETARLSRTSAAPRLATSRWCPRPG